MPPITPTHEPSEAFAGSAWSWDVTYSDFPSSSSWHLSYYIRGPIDKTLAWATEVTADGVGGFEVRVPATTTNDFTTAGAYRLVGRVSKSGDEFDGTVVYNGQLLVMADPTAAVNAKSFNRQMLEAVESALVDGVADSTEIKSIAVNGRAVQYRDRAELESRRTHYLLLVALEENPHGTVTHAVEFVNG